MKFSPALLDVIEALNLTGLDCRGWLTPGPNDGTPAMRDGSSPRLIVLAGNVGPNMWKRFSTSPEIDDGQPDPLDRWSQRVLGDIADRLGGPNVCEAVFPSQGPPYLPFQRWGQMAEPVHPSPIGPLIHPDYGLWHAYRGALLFAAQLSKTLVAQSESPCNYCDEQPCLSACPVNALRNDFYDVSSCLQHLHTSSDTDCNTAGCLARNACPIGADYTYTLAQNTFHIRAFKKISPSSFRRKKS